MKPRKCRSCNTGVVTSDIVQRHHYVDSGLPNVYLDGVELRRCSSCDDVEVVIPRITLLHRTIALVVVKKNGRFTGPEVRFLRKYLGFSGVDFAKRMGVSAEAVSRWENDNASIGAPSERLLRMMVVRDRPVEEYPIDRLAEIADVDNLAYQIDLHANASGWGPSKCA